MRFVGFLILALALGSRLGAQDTDRDSDLRSVVARISWDHGGSVRLASRETGRLEGHRVDLRGDSVLLDTDAGVRAIATMKIDSVWAQRGSAARALGIVAAVPCALYGALVGSFLASDPDSGGKPSHGALGGLIGGVIAGSVCGAAGAVVGSLIRRWQLEYARPTTVPT
jgi:hypothetical protein